MARGDGVAPPVGHPAARRVAVDPRARRRRGAPGGAGDRHRRHRATPPGGAAAAGPADGEHRDPRRGARPRPEQRPHPHHDVDGDAAVRRGGPRAAAAPRRDQLRHHPRC